MKHHSIKRFLVLSITCAVLVVYAVITAVSYFISKDELDELYDAHLKQVAEVIAAQPLTGSNADSLSNLPTKPIQNEEVFYIRLTDQDNQSLYVSHPKLQLSLTASPGFSTQLVGQQQWRVYTHALPQANVLVAQLLKGREVTIRETALSLVFSQLVFIPLLVLVILAVIHRALKPITQLSNQIQQRESNDLTPLNLQDTPSELVPLVQAINGFMAKVGAMVDTLKQFTADAAHELRTPITALKLQHTLITQAENTEERESAINNLAKGISRSEKIVAQLLTLARMSAPNHAQPVETIALMPVIKVVIESLLPLAQAKHIDLGLNSTVDYVISGVPEQIHLMVHNILENAIRYTPENGKIDLAISASDHSIIFEVKDTGPGIAEAELNRVFERFYRGTSKDQAGSGLGLAIVKNIANLHHARIELANLHPGLCFRVYFNKPSFAQSNDS